MCLKLTNRIWCFTPTSWEHTKGTRGRKQEESCTHPEIFCVLFDVAFPAQHWIGQNFTCKWRYHNQLLKSWRCLEDLCNETDHDVTLKNHMILQETSWNNMQEYEALPPNNSTIRFLLQVTVVDLLQWCLQRRGRRRWETIVQGGADRLISGQSDHSTRSDSCDAKRWNLVTLARYTPNRFLSRQYKYGKLYMWGKGSSPHYQDPYPNQARVWSWRTFSPALCWSSNWQKKPIGKSSKQKVLTHDGCFHLNMRKFASIPVTPTSSDVIRRIFNIL